MNTDEHLKRIRARCVELLAIAEKRTPGRWIKDTTVITHDIKANPRGLVAAVRFLGGDNTEGQANALFIASCAGSAEAGWKATIAAIDDLNGDKGTSFKLEDAILAAWPEGLL